MAKKKKTSLPQSNRSALREQQKAAERAKKRNRLIVAVVGIVVIALIPVSIAASQLGKDEVPVVVPTGVGPTGSATEPSTEPTIPTNLIPPNGTEEMGWIEVKSPKTSSKALIVDEHIDYQCGHCRTVNAIYGETFVELVERGDIILRVHLRSFLDQNHENTASTRAAMGSTCADTVGRFFDYHELVLYSPIQSEDVFSDQELREEFPALAGITGEDLVTFQQCYDEGWTLNYVQQMERVNATSKTINGATQSPPQGTPAFYVNGTQMFYKDIVGVDTATNKYAPLQPTTPDGFLTYLKTVPVV